MPTPTERVQECFVTNDGQPTDPRASLASAVTAVARAQDLDYALAAILATAAATVQPAMSAILVQQPDRPGLQVVAVSGLDEAAQAALAEAAMDPSDPFAEAIAGRTSAIERAGLMADGSAFIGYYVPLFVSAGGVDEALGALGVGWPAPHESTEAEHETLAALAGLAALAVDRARLAATAAERFDWFERMAHSDPLTGLANERTMGRVLELELARASRQSTELSFAMFDVDDFRATNRDGGQAAGDDVLRRVAAVLAESVRMVDTVGRIGGDEFVLIAPGSAGMTVAARVQAGIAALPAVSGKVVSISAGVARFPADGSDATSLIAAAKDALERARSGGGGNSVAATVVAAES